MWMHTSDLERTMAQMSSFVSCLKVFESVKSFKSLCEESVL